MLDKLVIRSPTRRPGFVCSISVALSLIAGNVAAGPSMQAGNTLLRHDIELLADHRILTGPVTSWPLAWGPILAEVRDIDQTQRFPQDVAASLARIRQRADWETRTHELMMSAAASAVNSPQRIRGFENTPREDVGIGSALSWTGERISVTLNGQYVVPDQGSADGRADGLMIGVAFGNWFLSLNTLERWWGPGWGGSLILSNNARPVPAIVLDRKFTDAFESPWLRWIGPWDFTLMFGQLESERAVPNTQLFGMRVTTRPVPSLEFGLSRTAQWCGDGRPCNAGIFADLLLGHDNNGDDKISGVNEPGNQLAGVDFRWSLVHWGWPAAIYGQFIGEDEASGFPSRFIGQFGAEANGSWRGSWSWRWFGEFAGTSCQFYESSELFNCAYNHSIYRTGYRYRGRSIGHAADNDTRILSMGLLLADDKEIQWRAQLRYGTLNRGPGPDERNSLTPLPQDILSVDLAHRRPLAYGAIEAGAGIERTDSEATGSNTDYRFYLQWRSDY